MSEWITGFRWVDPGEEVFRAYTLSEMVLLAERLNGHAEGHAAAVQWLRDRSAQHPPASLFHAAGLLADQLEASTRASNP